ncbi:MAG TPA: hypothetical protein VFW87_11520 [Pirellulales bacterium]|nr:hypothetical protein [Pirellulales bacterium]
MPITASRHDLVDAAGSDHIEYKVEIISDFRVILYFDGDFTGKKHQGKRDNLSVKLTQLRFLEPFDA